MKTEFLEQYTYIKKFDQSESRKTTWMFMKTFEIWTHPVDGYNDTTDQIWEESM